MIREFPSWGGTWYGIYELRILKLMPGMKRYEWRNNMTINYRTLDKMLKEEFDLESKTSQSGEYIRHQYFFKDRYIYQKKSEVFREVIELKNGGIGGYIYVGHLKEYDKHLLRDARGFMKIGSFTEQELREITMKVTKEYK